MHESVDDLVRCAYDEDVVVTQSIIRHILVSLDPQHRRTVRRAKRGLHCRLPY